MDAPARPESEPPAPRDPRTTGASPVVPPDSGPYRSGSFPVQRDPAASGPFSAPADDPGYRTSGAFPAARLDEPYRSGPVPTPTQSGQWNAEYRRSGQFPAPPAAASTGPYLTTRTGSFTPAVQAPSGAQPTLTRTGSQPAVAPMAWGSLVTDRAALAFVGAALLLAAAMIAYIATRYATFPAQIPLHFGPAGPSTPDRIGDKRELWTIPFIVGLVLAANVALAWALYRYDRFAARLMTFGSALVALIAWVVLLTLLHR